ncbi:DUF1549 and DUF1553 domain-containing protein [Thalassoroseus pseudoceratinae]|uniref:DUF1549 and DUF1553 domain-containing protein n=1 Tax=Thalassoroseus pseudoceratinae TaxID=2713176 RepID=UPI00197F4D21|nr:DUF1549 and DUF1553 domain-containing protein [Thalassoroseus pseudoceratinae]
MSYDPSKFDAAELADPELEQLLGDSYSAPPVPQSLLKRIDQTVKAEWGESPRLVDSRMSQLRERFASRRTWLRIAPLATAAAIVVVVGLLTLSGSTPSAWAKMLEALADRGVVEIETAEGLRWLSLSDRELGERTPQATQVWDVQNQVRLYRQRGTGQIQRARLESELTTEELAVSFFLGDIDSNASGRQIVSERCEEVNDVLVLHVEFDSPHDTNSELRLELDSDTYLPTRYQVSAARSAGPSSRVTYSSQPVADIRDREFPRELPVVDVDQVRPVAVAQNDAAILVGTNPNSGIKKTETTKASPSIPSNSVPDVLASIDWSQTDPAKWDAVPSRTESTEHVVTRVNTQMVKLWDAQNVQPVASATDEEMLRRVYLDLVGRTPSVHEVRAYLKDTSLNRYEQLVDRLLASPDHASHMAAVWRTFLIPEGVDLTAFGGVQAFDKWLADRFASGDSYDQIVRDLLLAEGRLSKSGPLLFYSAVKLNPEELASRTARVFLGMRLECAQCHDHPFEPWSQEDFWGFAAFFAQISRPNAELETVSSVMRVADVDHGEVQLPIFETVIPPKFLDNEPMATGDDKQVPPRRKQLADWLTSPDNPYFARATANRVWGHLFGKGIVDPMDDFGTQHPPKSRELLDLLAGHFVGSGFDLRELFRVMVLSKPYRLSSGADDVSEDRLEWFAQMNVKMLTAEQVYDCISVATLLESAPTQNPYEFNVLRFGNTERERFLEQFRTPAGRSTEYQAGIPQALTLMNGTLIEGATSLARSGLLASLDAPFFTNKQRVEVLYLATLSRRPTETEWKFLEEYVPQDVTGQELKDGLADILWVLLNSAEFTMNH